MIILTFTSDFLNHSSLNSSQFSTDSLDLLKRSADLPSAVLLLPIPLIQLFMDLLFQEWFSASPCCPECGCYFHGHGSVSRLIILNADFVSFTVPRVRCPHCGRTHRVIPSFFVPFLHNPVSDLEYVIRSAAGSASCSEAPFPAGRTHSVFSWKEAARLLRVTLFRPKTARKIIFPFPVFLKHGKTICGFSSDYLAREIMVLQNPCFRALPFQEDV